MVCDRTPDICPSMHYQDNDSFKKAVLELLVALAGGGSGSTVTLGAGSAAIGSVSINAALPAGANAIGTVAINAALPAGTNSIGTVVLAADSTMSQGRKVVATAGVREALTAGSVPNCKRVDIQALHTNTDVVVVGGSGVIAAAGTRAGIALQPGQVYSFSILDLNSIKLDVAVSGEGVSYTYFA